MPEELEHAIHVGAQLILLIDLPGQPGADILDVLVVDALTPVGIERVGHEFIHRLLARSGEKPQLVADDPAANSAFERVDIVDAVAGGQAAADEVV